MKRLRKILALCLALALSLTTITPSFAQTDTTQEASTAGQKESTVTINSGSSFKVTVPSTITINQPSKALLNEAYNVKVEGDITGIEKVKVVPESSFNLTQSGKEDVVVTVNQLKTEFTYDEINGADGLTTTGTLTTGTEVTAGTWTGNLTFNINSETRGQTFTVTLWKDFTGEGGANGVNTETLTFTASKELMPIEGEYGECTFSKQDNPCRGHYEITKPSFAYISFLCTSWEQTAGVGPVPMPFSLNYEVCLNKWLDSGRPIMTQVGGEIESATLTITQEDIDNAGGVYYLHINARAAMYPGQPIVQNVHLKYGVYEL